jgi:hypothetical protein
VSRDKSVKRSAQDDDFVEVLKKNIQNKLALMGLRPVFFRPCTLGRTWGTRPEKRASFFVRTTAPTTNSNWVATQT